MTESQEDKKISPEIDEEESYFTESNRKTTPGDLAIELTRTICYSVMISVEAHVA